MAEPFNGLEIKLYHCPFISRLDSISSLARGHTVAGRKRRGAVHALNFGILGFDDVILVRRVCAAAVAEAEGAGGEVSGSPVKT